MERDIDIFMDDEGEDEVFDFGSPPDKYSTFKSNFLNEGENIEDLIASYEDAVEQVDEYETDETDSEDEDGNKKDKLRKIINGLIEEINGSDSEEYSDETEDEEYSDDYSE